MTQTAEAAAVLAPDNMTSTPRRPLDATMVDMTTQETLSHPRLTRSVGQLENISTLEDGELDGLSEDEDPTLRSSLQSYASKFLNKLAASGLNSRSKFNKSRQIRRPKSPRENVNPTLTEKGSNLTSLGQNNLVNTTSAPKKKYNEFLIKKNKRTFIQDEGEGDIPFSAVKETYRYKAYVTKLSPDNDKESMKRHIDSKLGVDAYMKIVSKPRAPVLSLILDFTSDSDSLDLRSPGLWPRGTYVVKCKPPPKYNQHSAQGGSVQRLAGGQYQYGREGPQIQNSGDRPPLNHNLDIGNRYAHRSQMQQHMNEQWRD